MGLHIHNAAIKFGIQLFPCFLFTIHFDRYHSTTCTITRIETDKINTTLQPSLHIPGQTVACFKTV